MDLLAALTRKVLLFENKNENNFWNRSFRSTDSLPINLLSPKRARSKCCQRALNSRANGISSGWIFIIYRHPGVLSRPNLRAVA
jgi:hypothetical protein